MLAHVPAGTAADLPSAAITTLERRLVVHSDAPGVLDYVRSVYRRMLVDLSKDEDEACDTGFILTKWSAANLFAPECNESEHWLYFNGEPVEYRDEKPTTHFQVAFYGSSKLVRLSFRRNRNWHSMYGAALRLGNRAVVLSAHSGTGKTTLALELMARGAGFYGDEFIFIRKSDRAVSGLPRTMLIRERALSIFPDPRLSAACAASPPRTQYGDRIWDNIDPGDVFGERVFAQPAPLGAAIMLERGYGATAQVERVPVALAAADFTKHINVDATGFDRLADAALMFAGIPCYRIYASSPQSAANAIEKLLS